MPVHPVRVEDPSSIDALLNEPSLWMSVVPFKPLPLPPPTEPQLTPSDFDTLRAWFDAGAPALPEGTGCDVGEGDAGDTGDAPLD